MLTDKARQRLLARAARAARRGAGNGELVSVTCEIERPHPLGDLLRGAGPHDEPWALIEQPARERRGLLTYGAALELAVGGASGARFIDLAQSWQSLSARAQADPPGGVPGAGLVLLGGAAFEPGGGCHEVWSGFGAGSFVVPAVTVACMGNRAALTVACWVQPGDDPADHLEAAERWAGRLVPQQASPAALAAAAAGEPHSVLAPEHFTESIERAVAALRRGEAEKVVVAREVDVRATGVWDALVIADRLAARFPDCFVFAIGRGDGAMVGASPELLLRREGQRAETVALAGSSARSDEPLTDRALADALAGSAKNRHEHDLVVQRIVRALEPSALWVTHAPEPQIVSVANVHHLATPIRAQLGPAIGLIELVGQLHPTPAVGGEPSAAAAAMIPELDGFDRGWYAAPIGWVDQAGDGEFFVGLRSAVLRGGNARLFAGVGVVPDSDAEAELAETEVKLRAVLDSLVADA